MIVLTLQEIQFMLTVPPLTPDLRRILEALVSASNKVVSDDIADELRDLCTERLDTHGFDENYNPTEEGKKLELLIDKLYIG
ncbi:MAG TPA: hypothetical protein EYP90_09780 [Chromatiaceae bacterium]|nr:hypothetical protein [Chromatiaceae bacterium]